MSSYRASIATGYGITNKDGTPREAYFSADRWNDNITRHTLYTCVGTSQETWGCINGYRSGVEGIPVADFKRLTGMDPFWPATVNNTPGGFPLTTMPTGSFDALVGAQANKHLFNWVPVPYPAAAPMLKLNPKQTIDGTVSISLGQSISSGIAELTTLIQNTPGTFALIGMSQGSAVISGIMTQLQSGSLTSRYGDCIGAVAFGNPCRQAGKTFPGGTDPGGAGIFPSGSSTSNPGWVLNGNTPSWWWEMATPDDPIATAPTDLAGGGNLIRDIAEIMLSFTGKTEGKPLLESLFDALLYKGNLWRLIRDIMSSAGSGAIQSGVSWFTTNTRLNPSPHGLYCNIYPPSLPDEDDATVRALCPSGLGLSDPETTTYGQLALAYINARGAAVEPR